MKRVVVESPYVGDIEANENYVAFAMLWCFEQGLAPFASHQSYTLILDDDDKGQRKLGMRAGFAWGQAAEERIVFVDRGVSSGMVAGMREATKLGQPIKYAFIEPWIRNQLDKADVRPRWTIGARARRAKHPWDAALRDLPTPQEVNDQLERAREEVARGQRTTPKAE